mmetsp:Transcript_9721/g.11959  ORF Transcript_9721/g.11959 Transcript_9721/m.11959 type:complete len:394 (+) Transcript_9721:166-1347(+)
MSIQGGRIFYNANPKGMNDGRYLPICKTLETGVILLPVGKGIKCETSHYFSVDKCIPAASSVGGKLRGGKFFIGNWPNTPPGCFVGSSDKAIFFNKNLDGHSDGNEHQAVCIKAEYQGTLLPPGFGNKCELGYNFAEDECISAAKSVGGILRNGEFLVGFWPNKPYGCFIEESDKAIHFGTNPNGYNDGNFSPVCPSRSDISYEKGNFLIENSEASLTCFIKEATQDLYMHVSDNGNSVVMYGDEDYAKNSCNGPCPNSLFVLEKEPSQPNTWYIKASDQDLYMSVSDGNDDGTYVVMDGNEEYAKKSQCNGPCPNFVFVLEKVPWRFNAWHIKVSDQVHLNILAGYPNIKDGANEGQNIIRDEVVVTHSTHCEGPCPRALFSLECTILDDSS